jgi:hypothetical protein
MPECTQTCDLDPFNSVVTPESSDVDILRTEVEDYLRRLLVAVCADITCLEAQIDALDARVTALETP